MGLALTRLIFNEKRTEDKKIDRLLQQSLALREEAGLHEPLAETHNALGSLRQKQRAYAEAEVHYRESYVTRTGLLEQVASTSDAQAHQELHQHVAQSLVSLGNLFAEMAESSEADGDAKAAGAGKDRMAAAADERTALLQRALENLVAAKASYVAGFSENHPKLANAWEGIAKVHVSLREYDEAHEAVAKAIAIREQFAPIDPESGNPTVSKELEVAYKLLKTAESGSRKKRGGVEAPPAPEAA